MEPLFEAVLNDGGALTRLLKASPEAVGLRSESDEFVERVPHWLYVGDTALHVAAAALKLVAAEVLLEAGVDVKATNRRGATALHYACDPRPRSGGTWNPPAQRMLIALLAEHGAILEHADRGGATALHRAVRARSPAAVRELLRLGAHSDPPLGKRASTPLHLAVQSTGATGTRGVVAEQVEIIVALLQHGANAAACDARGR